MECATHNDIGTIRVLLADSYTLVRQGLMTMLQLQPGITVVGEVSNGSDAVDCFRRYRPDVMLLDVQMPHLDGIASLTAIRSEFPDAQVILLAMQPRSGDIFRGIQAGARGYLLKHATLELLLEAIRAVAAGQYWIPPNIAAQLASHLNDHTLTSRELDVLQELSKGKSNQQIALSLALSQGTVKFHINHLLQKLGVADRTQAVLQGLRHGLVYLD